MCDAVLNNRFILRGVINTAIKANNYIVNLIDCLIAHGWVKNSDKYPLNNLNEFGCQETNWRINLKQDKSRS